jgi:hypothetical protein
MMSELKLDTGWKQGDPSPVAVDPLKMATQITFKQETKRKMYINERFICYVDIGDIIELKVVYDENVK